MTCLPQPLGLHRTMSLFPWVCRLEVCVALYCTPLPHFGIPVIYSANEACFNVVGGEHLCIQCRRVRMRSASTVIALLTFAVASKGIAKSGSASGFLIRSRQSRSR